MRQYKVAHLASNALDRIVAKALCDDLGLVGLIVCLGVQITVPLEQHRIVSSAIGCHLNPDPTAELP